MIGYSAVQSSARTVYFTFQVILLRDCARYGKLVLSLVKCNKKVLLGERKRHTDSSVSSTPSVTRSGVPPPSRGTTPARSDVGGYLRWSFPPARSDGGYPRWSTPPHRSDGGYPRWGTPQQGTPQKGTHGQVWWGVPELDLAWVPPPPPYGPGRGTPLPHRCEQTENITFPHYSDAVGKKWAFLFWTNSEREDK